MPYSWASGKSLSKESLHSFRSKKILVGQFRSLYQFIDFTVKATERKMVPQKERWSANYFIFVKSEWLSAFSGSVPGCIIDTHIWNFNFKGQESLGTELLLSQVSINKYSLAREKHWTPYFFLWGHQKGGVPPKSSYLSTHQWFF